MMDEQLCSHSEDKVQVEKDELLDAYAAVQECADCGRELDRVILGSGSKYLDWSEEQIRQAF